MQGDRWHLLRLADAKPPTMLNFQRLSSPIGLTITIPCLCMPCCCEPFKLIVVDAPERQDGTLDVHVVKGNPSQSRTVGIREQWTAALMLKTVRPCPFIPQHQAALTDLFC
jgi:hypothetical protein